MAEKHPNKDGRHVRPSCYKIIRTQRSRSIDNELKRESTSQPVVRRERKLSMTSTENVTPASQRMSRVAQLIDRFEKFNSTDNDVLSSTTNMKISPPSMATIFTSSVKPVSIPVQQSKLTTAPPSKCVSIQHQSRPTTESRIITSIHDDSSDSTLSNQIIKDLRPTTNLINSFSKSAESLLSATMSPALTLVKLIPPPSRDLINTTTTTTTNSDDDSSDTSFIEEDKVFNDNKETNLFKRFEEVYETERTYVKKLRILSYDLPVQVKETCEKDKNLVKLFDETYKPLQRTLKQLYKFHSGVILSDIEQYRAQHRTDNMWLIFQDRFQTIEDLYKAYYITYAESQNKLERLCNTYPLIDQGMLKCQVYLDNLYPIAELNCANQRLLRYILLIKHYMKHLDKTSPEYEHTCLIHDEFNRIATRCEDQLAVSPSQFKKLKSRFDNKPECFENQQLIWHGLLKKQSPRIRTGIAQAYTILFSECILICKESGNKLEAKRQLSIKNITAIPLPSTTLNSTSGQQSNVITYYPFRVNAIEKSYKFLVDKESDRDKWISKIKQANEDLERRGADIEVVRQSIHRSDEDQFGIRAPAWINDTDVTRCQICHNRFESKIKTGRHHCRSCGRCVCSSCSTKRLILKYCNDEGEVRVCDRCYTEYTGVIKNSISSTKTLRNPDKTILFGDFHYSSINAIVWIDLQEDHQLHIYGGKLDQVEDFSINLTELREISFIEKTRTFVLNVQDKIYKFSIDLNHQINFQDNDYINETVKNTNNKTMYYANLWHDTMQLARSKSVPLWYTRKRVSSDSGIITVE